MSDYRNTYNEILAEIMAGREITEALAGENGEQREAYGKELRERHEAIKKADKSQPGWITRLLGGG